MTGLAPRRVSPFGHPEITARVQLPQAYRSLPRPSSPLDAKASTVCLIAFDLVSTYYGLDSHIGVKSAHCRACARHHASLTHTPSIHQLSKSDRRKRELVEQCGRLPEGLSLPDLPGIYSSLQKGGDPAAGSPTATLLRLRPSH